MIELIHIDEKYRYEPKNDQNLVLKNKIYGPEKEDISQLVEKIEWIASMKPGLGNITASLSETVRYEELDVFHLIVNDIQELYYICAPVYKKIRYPCLLIVELKDRFLLSVCPFSPKKLDYDENILNGMRLSHWIFPDNLSDHALVFISNINTILSEEGDLQTLYKKLANEIFGFHIGGITKSHAQRLISDMLGKSSPSILKTCTPYKKYKHINIGGKYANFSPKTESYTYRYDTEDLWHAFMSNEKLNKIITGRRYRDVDDLIYSIDSKFEEDSDF